MSIARNTGCQVQTYILLAKMLAHEWNEVRKNTGFLFATGELVVALVWLWGAWGLVDMLDHRGEQ